MFLRSPRAQTPDRVRLFHHWHFYRIMQYAAKPHSRPFAHLLINNQDVDLELRNSDGPEKESQSIEEPVCLGAYKHLIIKFNIKVTKSII